MYREEGRARRGREGGGLLVWHKTLFVLISDTWNKPVLIGNVYILMVV